MIWVPMSRIFPAGDPFVERVPTTAVECGGSVVGEDVGLF